MEDATQQREAVEDCIKSILQSVAATVDYTEPMHEAGQELLKLVAASWDEGGEAAIEREHTYGREEKAKFSNPYR